MLFKILGTVLTGIGGHYLNRRWDKAILFLCSFIFYAVFCLVALRTFLFYSISSVSASSDEMMKQVAETTETVSWVYLSGILILWLSSLMVTLMDGKKTDPVEIFKWTKTGIAAASLTTLISFLLLVFSVAGSISSIKSKIDHTNIKPQNKASSYSSHNFYEYLYFGGRPSNSERLPGAPTGKGLLKGQIYYDNKPAEAVSLNLILNSKYKARDIVTDSNGIFTVPLQLGDWKINSIQTKSWQNKPENEGYSIYYGGEEKLRGKSYHRYAGFQRNGYPVTIEENADKVHINIIIKENIKLTWPDPKAKGVNATITDTIRWEQYPEASQYYIKIYKLTREGTTTQYDPISSRVLQNETALPLSRLQHIKTKSTKQNEYSIKIYAFSDDGTLLGEFSDTFRGGTFFLSNGYVLVEDELQNFFNEAATEDPEVLEKRMETIAMDRGRIKAVEVLIDDNMIPEASRLLSRISTEYSKGEKEVLSGYIFAIQGDCANSKRMFDQALLVNPNVCIPKKYKDMCKH